MPGHLPLWALALSVATFDGARQLALYREASEAYGPALERLARGYERHEDDRRDLLQEIHVALWRSFAGFDGRCSLRTWVYRVAHNVSATRVARSQRARARGWVSLAELDALASPVDAEACAVERDAFARLLALVQRLEPVERQLLVLYLEGLEAAAIGEVLGLSAANVATRVYRMKRVLARQFDEDPQPEGEEDARRVQRTSGA